MRASVAIPNGNGLKINNAVLNSGTPFRFCFFLRMDVLWIWFFGYFLIISASGLDEKSTNKSQNIELYPPNPTYPGRTRMPRALFKKLHSGAAFLTGLKLGAILSKKGFELGHGKIASTHSFLIFGKPVNTAMSLSYGNVGSLLPLVDDPPQSDDSLKRTSLKKEDKKIFQVTVVENPFNETVSTLQDSTVLGHEEHEVGDEGAGIYENITYQGEDPGADKKSHFLNEHNRIVKEFNEGILRGKRF